ncbi:MAG TPA: hypothetical protein QF753_02620 [Victivallales bacterium]|nr:hypothetical protein [Victivallales bacterium]
MKYFLSSLCIGLMAVFMFQFNIFASVDVTSSLEDGIIKYLAPEGSNVKKGDPLVKFDSTIAKNELVIKKLELAETIKKLNDNTLDHQRTSKLAKSKAVSKAEAENDYFNYHISRIEVEKLKYEIGNKKSHLSHYIIKAPADCQVEKTIVTVNSGTGVGDKILTIKFT